jgi:ABC-type branched-subunit amino acid transport system substrate-binding protein
MNIFRLKYSRFFVSISQRRVNHEEPACDCIGYWSRARPRSYASDPAKVKIGILLPLTGTFAAVAETQRDGALLAIHAGQ